MKKTFKVITICLVILMLAGTFSVFAANSFGKSEQKNTFLQMLTINYATPSDFDSAESLIEASLVSLRDFADDYSFIDRNIVDSFIYNMYGIDSTNITLSYPDMPQRDGAFFLRPRGLDLSSYKIKSVSELGDTYRVDIIITVLPHDDKEYTIETTAVFERFPDSVYGYILKNIED